MRKRLVACMAALVSCVGLSACISDSDKITAYSVKCNERDKDGHCSDFGLTLNRVVYRIDRVHNEVVYVIQTFPDYKNKLIDCVILDVENWKCKYADGSGFVEMTNGVADNTDPTTVGVRWFYYRYLRIKEQGWIGLFN